MSVMFDRNEIRLRKPAIGKHAAREFIAFSVARLGVAARRARATADDAGYRISR